MCWFREGKYEIKCRREVCEASWSGDCTVCENSNSVKVWDREIGIRVGRMKIHVDSRSMRVWRREVGRIVKTRSNVSG